MCVVEELRAVDVNSSHQFEEEIGSASSENGLFIAKMEFSVWTAIIEQLTRATQELLDAIAPGDVTVWQKYLADDCLYTDEEGNVKTRQDLLKELTPLPKAYLGSIKMGEPKVMARENVIVLSHRDREELELYGQKLVTYFHSTDTWSKSPDGQWRLVAAQVMAIPNERKPIAVSLNKLNEYIGQYQLAPDVIYVVTREGDKVVRLLDRCDNNDLVLRKAQ
jgi:hypothetical protein